MLDSMSFNKTVLGLCSIVVYISHLAGYAFTGFAVLYIYFVSSNVFYPWSQSHLSQTVLEGGMDNSIVCIYTLVFTNTDTTWQCSNARLNLVQRKSIKPMLCSRSWSILYEYHFPFLC